MAFTKMVEGSSADLRNDSSVTEFIIVGFPSTRDVEVSLFILFLSLYLLSVTGNIIIIMTLKMDTQLHTPMYFFLGNLSFLDVGYTTVTVPKLLSILLTGVRTIPFAGCLLQSYFFFFLGTAECFLLAVMAYDRYIAICYPLRYSVIMSQKVCVLLIIGSWVGGCMAPLVAAFLVISLPFCGPNIVNHFFCDIPPLLKLACVDTSITQKVIFLLSALVILGTFLSTVVSYLYIVITILRISSSEGRHKAFSTCASHLTVVSLYYGTVIFMYVSPTTRSSFNMNKIVAVVYSVVTPTLNPMIYSLRNQDMKKALKKILLKRRTHGKEFEWPK
ncbi:olfactory receptor 6M1-like [Alligator mississippiensis]|uniref:olfactory receptor 6M1-like n=1 Tax=Alligator mississippiensis TaxID=8496 RepID=UPI0003D0A370|nr:olfactory receptor 6M1-like [Alligator mississippiensis]